MQNSQSTALRTMVARVSPDDIVIYANASLASYLGVDKKVLIGTPLDVLARRCRGEISTCFARPETGRFSNHLVTDEEGRVFEAKLYSDGGVLDIVLDEVTTADSIGRELRDSSGTPFESLNEEELRTTRYPERRYLTVIRTQLRGLAPFTERLAPMEVRLMVNSFVEESCDAILETGCTVGETSGDAVLGIFGAPRYFADHPLRAIHAACDQMQKAAMLHAGFYREGKEMPPCSCGIWTGDTLVGTLGNSAWQHYTAVGMPVDLAAKLCQLARPGEILLPEHTLTHLLRTLPENWQHVRAESEFEPDLSDFQWSGDEIAPVPEQLKKVVYLLGPGVQENSDNVELYFDYLWAYQVPGRDTAVPILRVVRPAEVGSQLELSDDNVVTTQAVQTLGKYKLIEVIGTGGMGKVWRGVDRFGNSVAIKVLHSAEPATDTQLRRFRREAEVMAKLPHRNICRVYEMNEFDGIQYIAMEFVDGLPLSDLLYEKTASESSGKTLDNVDLRVLITSLKSERSRSRSSEGEGGEDGETASRPKNTRILPVEQTLSIILKVSDAVQFAHEHGILHRDLKPGNILLREDGEPLVADFGLAKMSSADATHSLSISGHVVGTLENMSPEQAESSKDVDERADVYSIGTMLYQMLTGRRHFEATGNIVADAQVLKTHEPVRPRAFNPRINPDLEIITLKALRNDPVERYRSVAALAADIQHYRRGEVISARPVHLFEVFKKLIQRNKGVSAVVAASIVIFVVGALVSIAILSHSLTEQNRVVSQLKERDAEVARKSAEIAEQIAKNKEISVEIQDKVTLAALSEKNADIARKRAKDALEELKAKQAEVEAEQQKSKEAVAKTKEALAASEEDKRLREELEQRIEKARLEEERQSGDVSSPPSSRSEAQRQESLRAVQQQFDQARQLFFLEASPFFPRQQANADGIIDRLKDAMDHVTQALLISPDFLPGWMLKGRIHLVLLEYDRAAESFREALKYVDNFPGAIAKDNPEVMVKLTRELSAGLGDKYSKGAEILDESPDPQNKTTGQMMKIVAGKPGSKFSTDPAGPLNRAVTANEAALALLARNPPGTKVFVKPGGIGVGTEIILWGSSEITDLSPLKEIELSGLTIAGAKKIDWPTLFTLTGLESLNLSQCGLERFPVTPQSQRSFLNLKSLCLAGTHVNSLDFIRTMTGLEKLDLTNSDVTDLTPLLLIRDRLRELKLGGLNPVNLRALLNIPLESLTVSPMLISDQAGLIALSQNRVLKVIRAPGDPKDQSAAEFWRKLESHAYATSE